MKRILLLTSNPSNTSRLRLGEELREIKHGLQRQKGEEFIIEMETAVRPVDIRRAMLDFKPNYVHFSGHGSGEGGLIFEDNDGNSKYASTDALSSLFELFSEIVDCIVLNSCYSEMQTLGLTEHVDYVIGMNNSISDRSAIQFSIGFYDALVAGQSIENAFRFGKNAVSFENVDESNIPILLKKSPPILSNFLLDKGPAEYRSEKKEIIVGFTYDTPMFYYDKNENLRGFGYELALRLSEELGKKLIPKVVNYSNLAEKIHAGELDVAIGGLIAGDKHGKELFWSIPYLKANFCLVVPNESKLKSIEDINGLRVGVYDEPYVKLWVEKYLPKSKMIPYSYPNWFECIKNGEVDVIINDFPYAAESMKFHPELKFANYHLSYSDVGYAICLPPNESYKAVIDRELKKIMDTKWYKNLHKKYFEVNDAYLNDKYKEMPYKEKYITKKNDSVEKIAKKFLGDETKWHVIYNINKHVLPSPWIVEPGLTIYIPKSINEEDETFMKIAIEYAKMGMERNDGGPFGAIVVKNGEIVGTGNNKVTSTNDPTAHAEIVAIRDACINLNTFQLNDCTIYTSCEPCPMCLGAIYWARPSRIVFACDRFDAAAIEFDDEFIYEELNLPNISRKIPTSQILRTDGLEVFKKWRDKSDKKKY